MCSNKNSCLQRIAQTDTETILRLVFLLFILNTYIFCCKWILKISLKNCIDLIKKIFLLLILDEIIIWTCSFYFSIISTFFYCNNSLNLCENFQTNWIFESIQKVKLYTELMKIHAKISEKSTTQNNINTQHINLLSSISAFQNIFSYCTNKTFYI